jgi:hydroxymethylglutaryl-CoA reductase
MIVHFSVQHSGNRHIVEVHTNPETAVSRFEQVKSLVSSGNLDGELSLVSARGGQDLTREKYDTDAIEAAINYMNN